MKTRLEWSDLFQIMKRDAAGRWHADHESAQKYVEENGYRSPSQAWRHSHSKALLTKKFVKWLIENDAELAKRLGVV